MLRTAGLAALALALAAPGSAAAQPASTAPESRPRAAEPYPIECLSRLPRDEFRIVREADIAMASPADDLPLTASALKGVNHSAMAWDTALSSPPALHA